MKDFYVFLRIGFNTKFKNSFTFSIDKGEAMVYNWKRTKKQGAVNMYYSYTPKGVCPIKIEFDIDIQEGGLLLQIYSSCCAEFILRSKQAVFFNRIL